MEVWILISDFKGNENVNDISNSVFLRQIKGGWHQSTPIRDKHKGIRTFIFNFRFPKRLGNGLGKPSFYYFSFPFFVLLWYWKTVSEILMLFFCFIEISLALLTKPEACRTSCYLEKAWKPRICFGRPALTFNVYYLLSKFRCHSLYTFRVKEGAFWTPLTPPIQERKTEHTV